MKIIVNTMGRTGILGEWSYRLGLLPSLCRSIATGLVSGTGSCGIGRSGSMIGGLLWTSGWLSLGLFGCL